MGGGGSQISPVSSFGTKVVGNLEESKVDLEMKRCQNSSSVCSRIRLYDIEGVGRQAPGAIQYPLKSKRRVTVSEPGLSKENGGKRLLADPRAPLEVQERGNTFFNAHEVTCLARKNIRVTK